MTITNGYTDLATVRSELGNYAASDTSDDTKIERSVEAASRQIDGYCGRRFWVDATVKTREYHPYNSYLCEVDDISTVIGLIVAIDQDGDGTFETTLTITTDFLLRPTNAADEVPVRPYEELRSTGNYSFPCWSNGRPGVQVTAAFGWPAVPDDVEKACIIQAVDLFKSKDAAFGVAGIGEMGVLRVKSGLNATAAGLLAPYRKPAVG